MSLATLGVKLFSHVLKYENFSRDMYSKIAKSLLTRSFLLYAPNVIWNQHNICDRMSDHTIFIVSTFLPLWQQTDHEQLMESKFFWSSMTWPLSFGSQNYSTLACTRNFTDLLEYNVDYNKPCDYKYNTL